MARPLQIGNINQKTDARGTVVSYTYDALNRLTATQFSDQSQKERQRGQPLTRERAQGRVAHAGGWKSRHGRSQSHVAWMAGGDGNVAF